MHALKAGASLSSTSSTMPYRKIPTWRSTSTSTSCHAIGVSTCLHSSTTSISDRLSRQGYTAVWAGRRWRIWRCLGPFGSLKKVLRGTLWYLGVLWLFAQFPNILCKVLGSVLRENEGSLLNHDPNQPELWFFIGPWMWRSISHKRGRDSQTGLTRSRAMLRCRKLVTSLFGGWRPSWQCWLCLRQPSVSFWSSLLGKNASRRQRQPWVRVPWGKAEMHWVVESTTLLLYDEFNDFPNWEFSPFVL